MGEFVEEGYQTAFPWNPEDFPDVEERVPEDPSQGTGVHSKMPKESRSWAKLKGATDTFSDSCCFKDRYELERVVSYLRINGNYDLQIVSTRPHCILMYCRTRPDSLGRDRQRDRPN